jgi:hypothetical protein
MKRVVLSLVVVGVIVAGCNPQGGIDTPSNPDYAKRVQQHSKTPTTVAKSSAIPSPSSSPSSSPSGAPVACGSVSDSNFQARASQAVVGFLSGNSINAAMPDLSTDNVVLEAVENSSADVLYLVSISSPGRQSISAVVDCSEQNPSNLSVVALAWNNADTGGDVMKGSADPNPGVGQPAKCPAADDSALNASASKIISSYVSRNTEISFDTASAQVSLVAFRSNSKESYYLALDKTAGQAADIVAVVHCEESDPSSLDLPGYSWWSSSGSPGVSSGGK